MVNDSSINTHTVFLYPSSPLDQTKVDENYTEEYNALKKAGLSVHLLDIENISFGKILPTIPENTQVIYRGWMLNESLYSSLENRFENQLLTSKKDYLNAHHLPNWYPLLKDFTIRSVITTEQEVKYQFERFGEKAFLKDFVKSLKTGKGSIVDSAEDIDRAIHDMKYFRGTIEGGLVLREVIDLVPNSEIRYFVLYNTIYYPRDDAPKYKIAKQIVETLKPQNLKFYSIDIASTKGGSNILIEIGDGQVSDYVGWDIKNFVSIFQ